MYTFQAVSFVLEIVLGLAFGIFIALFPVIFFDFGNKGIINYTELHNFRNSKIKKKVILNITIRSIWIIAVLGITIYLLKPFFLDVPKLVKGDYNYITGYVDDVTMDKSQGDNIYIEGKDLKYFFSSGIEAGKRYKIGYLPNTSRVIYGELLDNNEHSKGTMIKFPYKDILLYIGIIISILLIFALIYWLSPYVRFKVLIAVSIIFYPLNILLYIKEGLKSGLWFSFYNMGLLFLTIGAGSILLLLLIRNLERRREARFIQKYTLAQIMSIVKIIILTQAFQQVFRK